MSYKLYDFSDPELDEQIRLLCDVLYNHREQYPGQIGGNTDLNLPRPNFEFDNPHTCFFQANPSTLGSASTAVFEYNTYISQTGYIASVAADFDISAYFSKLVTTTALNNISLIVTTGTGTDGSYYHLCMSRLRRMEWHVKTGATADFSNAEHFVYARSVPSGTESPTDNNQNVFVGFRYDPVTAVDTKWTPVVRGALSASITTLVSGGIGPVVTANTQYCFQMTVLRTAANTFTFGFRVLSKEINTSTGALIASADSGWSTVAGVAWDESRVPGMGMLIQNKVNGTARTFYIGYAYAESKLII